MKTISSTFLTAGRAVFGAPQPIRTSLFHKTSAQGVPRSAFGIFAATALFAHGAFAGAAAVAGARQQTPVAAFVAAFIGSPADNSNTPR